MIKEMYVVLKLRKWIFTRFIADLLGISGSSLMFRDHTQKTTFGRTPLDKRSTRLRDLYLTIDTTSTSNKHSCPRRDSNPHSQQASGRRPHTLHRTALRSAITHIIVEVNCSRQQYSRCALVKSWCYPSHPKETYLTLKLKKIKLVAYTVALWRTWTHRWCNWGTLAKLSLPNCTCKPG